jgi:5-methylcytosine-specific restriction endonuclease McrA
LGLIDEASEALVAARAERDARVASALAKRGRSQMFYASQAWKRLRYRVLAEQGGRCQACGRTAKDGVVMHIDHVKPVSKHWDLRLDKNNLQVTCDLCNIGKSNISEEDWRS